MKCEEFLTFAHDYADGECTKETEKQIKEHLRICPKCTKLYEEIIALKGIVADIGDITVPESMAKDALAAIEAEIEEGKPRFRLPSFFTSWPMYVTVAACFLLFFLLKDTYKRQTQSFVYTDEGGAVAVTEKGESPMARALPNGTQVTSSYSPMAYLAKHKITFVVTDKAAEAVFNSVKSMGTDGIIRAFTEKGILFAVTYGPEKDYTAEYNALVVEANEAYSRLAQGDTSATSVITSAESRMLAIKNDCSVPLLSIAFHEA